jgi:hypothetical protein
MTLVLARIGRTRILRWWEDTLHFIHKYIYFCFINLGNQDFAYTYGNLTNEPPSQEFPAAGYGPLDFHCERSTFRFLLFLLLIISDLSIPGMTL